MKDNIRQMIRKAAAARRQEHEQADRLQEHEQADRCRDRTPPEYRPRATEEKRTPAAFRIVTG